MTGLVVHTTAYSLLYWPVSQVKDGGFAQSPSKVILKRQHIMWPDRYILTGHLQYTTTVPAVVVPNQRQHSACPVTCDQPCKKDFWEVTVDPKSILELCDDIRPLVAHPAPFPWERVPIDNL